MIWINQTLVINLNLRKDVIRLHKFLGMNCISRYQFYWCSIISMIFCLYFLSSANFKIYLCKYPPSIRYFDDQYSSNDMFFILCQVSATFQYLLPSQYCHNDIIINMCVFVLFVVHFVTSCHILEAFIVAFRHFLVQLSLSYIVICLNCKQYSYLVRELKGQ